jgi:SAM-dependent methyltransferase
MQKGSYQFEQLESRNQEVICLAERAQLRLDGFIDLITRHDFPTQGNILEIGCAQGIRTNLMAQHAPKTKVLGIDRSSELLKIANEKYSHIQNLSFQEADLYDLPFSKEHFDYIYARLVFMHLNDPISALLNLKRVLRPGGTLLIEDADRDCMFFEPEPSSFKSFWQKVQDGQRRLGGDPNIGRKLAPHLKETGFHNVQIEAQPIIGNGEEIKFLARTLLRSLNLYLEPSDREEGERAIDDLIKLTQDPRASFYHFWFVVSGKK